MEVPAPSMRFWSPAEVVKYFVELGQDNAAELLKQVDGQTLLLLTENDLREIGLSLGPVRKHLHLQNTNAFTRAVREPDRNKQYDAGLKYLNGLLGESEAESRMCALQLFQLASAKGHPEAMLSFGLLLGGKDGDAWVKKAFNTNNAFVKGRCFMLGIAGQKKQPREAIACFEIAASDGHVEAQFRLGELFSRNERNHLPKSFMWFERAAKLGHADAQFRVGECYAKGIGVSRDEKMATVYYNLAANQGQKDAIQMLKDIQIK